MWQILITILLVGLALAYVIRSLLRSARGRECRCTTNTCAFAQDRKAAGLPCQSAAEQQAVSTDSLEESARNLARKHSPPAGTASADKPR